MFILDTDRIPATTDDLTRAITSSLKRSIRLPADANPVKITGMLPKLSEILIDVSLGEVDSSQPLPDPTEPANQQPGPVADSFIISGDPVITGSIPIKLYLSAKQMSFAYARNQSGNLIATPRDASDGRLSVHIFQKQLELALLTLARLFAAPHDVDILKVEANLKSTTPTELNLLLRITAKKYMTAVVNISGRLRIDDQMIATATNLKADSSGMVGAVVVKILQPQLAKLEGRRLLLMAYSLGNLKLRGVAVDTSDGLRFTANFGS